MKEIRKLSDFYKSLSDVTRLRILNLLVNRGDICVCDLVKVLKISQGRISSHLKILRSAELVNDKREGLWIIYSIPKRTNKIYRCQLSCLKKQILEIHQFKKDLQRFDELKKRGILAQCNPQTKGVVRAR